MQQLTLGFNYPFSYLEKDFQVGEANREAYYRIRSNIDWPKWGAIIYGAAGSGKTYLGHIWQQHNQASFIQSDFLKQSTIDWTPFLPNIPKNYILDFQSNNLPQGDISYQHHFLELINILDQHQHKLLICTRQNPIEWLDIKLPDLKSRQQSMLAINIKQPEENLFRKILQKMLLERGIFLAGHHLDFLSIHAERSYQSISWLVYEIDQQTFRQKSPITITNLKSILDRRP